ncbi:MAG: rhodanese-like domain-containing protein [Candidatus Binatia bacterium]
MTRITRGLGAFISALFTLAALRLMPVMNNEISVQQLKTRLDAGDEVVLLDVREPEEVALVRLPGAIHIPMGEVPGRLHELDPDKEIVVYCHHGVRSLRVANFLAQRDFTQVTSLAGGIDAWAIEIEPGMARY